MTNYQKCTNQWDNLEKLLPTLKVGVKKIKKCEQILRQLRQAEGEELEILSEKLNALKRDMLVDLICYKQFEHCIDGIKIAKGQISFEEFEGLLYFALLTDADRTQWFENFETMYPWITYAFDKRLVATN